MQIVAVEISICSMRITTKCWYTQWCDEERWCLSWENVVSGLVYWQWIAAMKDCVACAQGMKYG